MENMIEDRWYLFACASGLAFILTFYPFYLWPLCFVALVPLIAVAATNVPLKKIFLAGAIAVAMVVFLIGFLIAIQFHWAPATATFMFAATYGAVTVGTLIYATLFGLWLVAYRVLRSSSFLLHSLAGATLYALCERVAQVLLGGYYLPSLAHSAVSFLPLAGFASIGGASVVTAIIVWINIALVQFILYPSKRVKTLQHVGSVLVVLALLGVGSHYYSESQNREQRPFTVAVVQISSPEERVFATTTQNGVITFPKLAETFTQAAKTSPDLIVYPESLIMGIADEKTIALWMKHNAPKNIVIATWDNVARDGKVFTGYNFWRNGEKIGELYKQELVPFMDYTPMWARPIELSSMSFDVSPAPVHQTVLIEDTRVGGLVCSEAHRPNLARTEANKSNLILAATSDAMFIDDGVGLYTLASARYRAIENNVPVIRASLMGTSAFIQADGSLAGVTPLWSGGIPRSTLTVYASHSSVFSKTGNTPFFLLAGILLLLAFVKARREKIKSPGIPV